MGTRLVTEQKIERPDQWAFHDDDRKLWKAPHNRNNVPEEVHDVIYKAVFGIGSARHGLECEAGHGFAAYALVCWGGLQARL
jgi:hypothetical protein